MGTITEEQLQAAMKKAVEVGLVPKMANGDGEYLQRWEAMRQVLQVAEACREMALWKALNGCGFADLSPYAKAVAVAGFAGAGAEDGFVYRHQEVADVLHRERRPSAAEPRGRHESVTCSAYVPPESFSDAADATTPDPS